MRYDKSGIPYLIKAGKIPDDNGQPYYFAIGRSLDPAAEDGAGLDAHLFFLAAGDDRADRVAGMGAGGAGDPAGEPRWRRRRRRLRDRIYRCRFRCGGRAMNWII